MKSQSNEWEKIFANDISKKELICNIYIYKELIQLNIKTPRNPIKREAQDPNRHLQVRRVLSLRDWPHGSVFR